MDSRPCPRFSRSGLSPILGAVAWMVMALSFQADTPRKNLLVPINPGAVKVGGEIGRRIDMTVNNNLLKLDIDKDFLERFRRKNGVADSAHPDRYVGLGKLIDATVSFAINRKDPRIVDLKNRLIGELIKTQLADGYIGIFKQEHRVFTLWDLHEMVYIIHGLVADYRGFGSETSLSAARRLGDYIIAHRQGTEKPRAVGKLNTERAFIALSQAAGNRKYLDYAVDGMDLRNWSAPVSGHAYTFMNVCLAQMDLYDIAPDENLLRQGRKVIEYLTARDGLLVSGSCSRGEGFHDNQDVSGDVEETCATAYLIRLLHRMLCIEGTSSLGDIMERAVFNALPAAQLPEGRRLRYFTPLEGKRPVFEWDTYCCPNNFRRIVAELPRMVYYRSDDGGLAVNLYTPSSAVIPFDEDLRLNVRQQTDYPNSGKVRIHINPSRPDTFPLRLRIPAWCDEASVAVNGRKVEEPVKIGAFFIISRKWKSGDHVDLEMPMSWRPVRGRKMQQGRVALLRGPLLFCLDPQRLLAMNPHLAERLDHTEGGVETSKPEKDREARLADIVKQLRLDLRTLGRPVHDDTVRPGGLACPVRAWSPGASTSAPPDLKLLLTEFADPAGEATYFLVPDGADAVEDELYRNR